MFVSKFSHVWEPVSESGIKENKFELCTHITGLNLGDTILEILVSPIMPYRKVYTRIIKIRFSGAQI